MADETQLDSTTKAAPVRDDLLLGAMADQQSEFERFRENVAERLGRLEKKSHFSLAEFDYGKLVNFAMLAIAALVAFRIGLQLIAYLKVREKSHDHFSLPEA